MTVEGSPGANNETLVDDNQNQNLTTTEIEKLKDAGLTGQVSESLWLWLQSCIAVCYVAGLGWS